MTKLLSYFDFHKHFNKTKLYFLTIGFLITWSLAWSCSSPVDIPGFDKKAWQEDVRSCNNVRPSFAPVLKKYKNRLMGLNHNQVLALLGKPDGNSLEKSGERVYTYYLQAGEQCQNKKKDENAGRMLIWFDALDWAYKIRFENGMEQ